MRFVLILIVSGLLLACQSEKQPPQKPNIIFISVDDLRPDIGAYGNPHIKTPNIDAFANEALLLENMGKTQKWEKALNVLVDTRD